MNERHCENCRWTVKEPMRSSNGEIVIGKYTFTCHRAPPTAVAITATDQASGESGVMMVAVFPPVDATMFCSFHDYADDAEPIPGEKPVG